MPIDSWSYLLLKVAICRVITEDVVAVGSEIRF